MRRGKVMIIPFHVIKFGHLDQNMKVSFLVDTFMDLARLLDLMGLSTEEPGG